MLELNGQWHERSFIAEATDPNTGGFQLFVAPGVRLTWSSNVNAFLSLGLPLVQDLHGVQSETDFRVSTGVGFAF
jgi:hypothetical protein